MNFEIEVVMKLALACVFGGMIGYIREKHQKAAGLRTHMMVCMGASLFMIISIYMSKVYSGVDASRIASTVVTGIGFIGGGAIIREGGMVKGLTTASSIWAVAAIGLAIGSGLYLAALFATLLGFVVLHILSYIERKYISPKNR